MKGRRAKERSAKARTKRVSKNEVEGKARQGRGGRENHQGRLLKGGWIREESENENDNETGGDESKMERENEGEGGREFVVAGLLL